MALKTIIKDRLFTDKALLKVLTEVESIVNSRRVSDDIVASYTKSSPDRWTQSKLRTTCNKILRTLT